MENQAANLVTVICCEVQPQQRLKILQLLSLDSSLPILLILKSNLDHLLSALFNNLILLIAADHCEACVIFRAGTEIIALQPYHPRKWMTEV